MKRLLPLLFLSLFSSAALADPVADGVKAVTVYDAGLERNDIVTFDDYIRAQPSADRGKIEAALLPLLDQPISIAAKGYVIRWMQIIGSSASVPALQKLTSDPKLSHLAVYALLSIPAPEAKTALVSSLGTTPADLRPAIIGAIGRAGIASAVPQLAPLVSGSDKAQALAAIDALGAIGTADALAALRSATPAGDLAIAQKWATLHAATDLVVSDATDAKSAFTSLIAAGNPSSLRIAAARGCILADPTGAWTIISPLLKDDDARVRLGMASLTSQLPTDNIAALVTLLPSLDPTVQTVVVSRMAGKKSAEAEPVLQAALASTQPDVHLAAIAGYGTVDLPGSAAVLLPLLVKGGDETTAAAASLEILTQPEVSGKLLAAVGTAQGPAKAALLDVLTARVDKSALDLFFSLAADPDNGVAEAAFRGIEVVATPDDLSRITGLLPQAKTGNEHKSLNAALTRCAGSAPDKDKAADFLIGALPSATGDSRSSILAAIASIDSPKATAWLQTQLAAPAVDDRKTVIRALSTVHNPGADKLLLGVASTGKEDSEKILALRGYLDSIREQKLETQQKVNAYKVAWPLATRDDDKQAILAALKNMDKNEAKKAIEELSATKPKST